MYVLDALIYTLTYWPKSASIQTDQSNSTNPMTSSARQTTNREELQVEPTQTVPMETSTSQTHDTRFFKRSESILASSGAESEGDAEMRKSNRKFFGISQGLPSSPDLAGNGKSLGGGQGNKGNFSQPLSEAFPLAQQPHLLKPFAKKEQLFSSPSRVQGGCEGEEEGEGGEERRRGKGGASLPVSYSTDTGG